MPICCTTAAAAGGPRILVTQGDIRAIQLAKSALYAGARLLMDELGVDSVDRVVLAGAFGAHISPKHAMVLGMIPDCAARAGDLGRQRRRHRRAHRAVQCRARGARSRRMVRRIHKVETAIEPRFQEHFVAANAIPHATAAFPELAKVVTLPDGQLQHRRRRRRPAAAPVISADPIAELIAGIARADRAAFRALYSQASAKLFGVCLRILRDRSEAEDAVQEVFTRIWLNARRYQADRGRGMTWLIAIARNHAIDRLRARPAGAGGSVDEAAALADPAPGPEARVLARGEALRIAECFDRLEPTRAAAVRGAYLRGLSYEELSARHGVPLNTMRSWLRRGLQTLKECLEA